MQFNNLVSIIMPNYNTCSLYLNQSISSVLKQTYNNFELIIIDDGSSEENYRQLEKLAKKDARIIVLRNSTNRGVAYTLNRAMERSKGTYLFRMDADDICIRSRLYDTIRFMESNPKIDIVGTQCISFREGRFFQQKKTHLPLSNDAIKATLLLRSPIVHPTVCFRRTSVEKYGIRYDDNAKSKAEDYRLWVKCSIGGCTFANMRRATIRYRIHDSQVTNTNAKLLGSDGIIIRKELLDSLGIVLDQEDFALYCNYAAGRVASVENLLKADSIAISIAKSVPSSYVARDTLLTVMAEKCFHEALRLALSGVPNVTKAYAKTDSSTILRRKQLRSGMLGTVELVDKLMTATGHSSILDGRR